MSVLKRQMSNQGMSNCLKTIHIVSKPISKRELFPNVSVKSLNYLIT